MAFWLLLFRTFMALLIILNYMDKQLNSTICATLNCNIQTVWKVVTSLNDYSWRSDIVSISFSDKRHFTERNSDDIITHFIVRVFDPYSQYSFDLDNKNLYGTWTGYFKQVDAKTEIQFIEMISVKKWWLYPFAKWYLKKQQKQYVSDLKRKCERYE